MKSVEKVDNQTHPPDPEGIEHENRVMEFLVGGLIVHKLLRKLIATELKHLPALVLRRKGGEIIYEHFHLVMGFRLIYN